MVHGGSIAVLLLFCLPLFIGLGNWDVGNDEAIYSYAVDRILETGDWLTPRSIPSDTPFLEKPPLKFWIVAAPIRAGLLPHNEFGLRFFDALCGAAAFAYVYALGLWLAGPLCGFTAVLLLFTVNPLLFEHGLRSNNMEAPLFLCYCGGLYHFSRWVEREREHDAAREPASDVASKITARRDRVRHAFAVAAYFTLGFMTKFVAALFLPLVCLVALAWRHDAWRIVRERWRDWLGPALLVVAVSLPWFVYETWQFGRLLWDVMFGAHVYTRFTSALDPGHLQPWNFYYVTIWKELTHAGSAWIVVAGTVTLAVAALAISKSERAWLSRLLLVWGVLPLALISIGTSKVFHYAYPFLPPLALGAGYAAALFFHALDDKAGTVISGFSRIPRAIRWSLIGAGAILFGVGMSVAIGGPLHWEIGNLRLLRASSIVWPIALGSALIALAGEGRWSLRMLLVLALTAVLPVSAYRATLARAMDVKHPLRTVRDCALAVKASGAEIGAGVYNAADLITGHEYFYYLRGLAPWTLEDHPRLDEVRRRVFVHGHQTPVVIARKDYELWTLKPAFTDTYGPPARIAPASLQPPDEAGSTGVAPHDNIVVLLPGPYRTCVPPAVLAGGRQVGENP
jgi:4-amino-4-deoxy-L-arabinose transferase-like glycosyltransferase